MKFLKSIALLFVALPALAAQGYINGPTINTATGKVSLSYAGVVNVAASSATISTPTIVLDGAAGSVIADLPNKFFNIAKYGAKSDGTTDDTVAVQAAVTAAGAVGGSSVFFPTGITKVSAPIIFPPTSMGINLVGAGWSGFNGQPSYSSGSVVYMVTTSTTLFQWYPVSGGGCLNIQNLAIRGPGGTSPASTNGTGVRLNASLTNSNIVSSLGCYYDNVIFEGWGVGLDIEALEDSSFKHLVSAWNGEGILISSYTSGYSNSNVFTNTVLFHDTTGLLVVNNSDNAIFNGGTIESNTENGIVLNNEAVFSFSGWYVENPSISTADFIVNGNQNVFSDILFEPNGLTYNIQDNGTYNSYIGNSFNNGIALGVYGASNSATIINRAGGSLIVGSLATNWNDIGPTSTYAGTSQFGSGVAQSTFTALGFLNMGGAFNPQPKTIAQLLAITPHLGDTYRCTDCSPLKIVIATGTSAGNFSDAVGAAFK